MDDRDRIIKEQKELLGNWKASCLAMQSAILNTINLARRDETLDPIDACYIITIHQVNDLRRVVGIEPATQQLKDGLPPEVERAQWQYKELRQQIAKEKAAALTG